MKSVEETNGLVSVAEDSIHHPHKDSTVAITGEGETKKHALILETA